MVKKRGPNRRRCFIFLTLSSALFLAGCLYGWRFDTPVVYWTSLPRTFLGLKSLSHSVIISPLLGSVNVTPSSSEPPAGSDDVSVSEDVSRAEHTDSSKSSAFQDVSRAEHTDSSKSSAFQDVASSPARDLQLGKFIGDISTHQGTETAKNTQISPEPRPAPAIELLQPLSSAEDIDISPRDFSPPDTNHPRQLSSRGSDDLSPTGPSASTIGYLAGQNSTAFGGTLGALRFRDPVDTDRDKKAVTNANFSNVQTDVSHKTTLNATTPHFPIITTTTTDANNTSAPDQNETYLITINHDNGRLGNKLFKYASLLGIAHAASRHAFVAPYSPTQDLAKIFQLSRVENHSDQSKWTVVTETQYGYFDPIFHQLPEGHVRLHGYVQSWKYFDKIQREVRQEFTLRPGLRDLVKKTKDEIRRRLNQTDLVFVGVHVRQRDGYSNPNTCEAPRSFFGKAFDKLRGLLHGKNLVFVVAGNNLSWCRENLRAPDVVVLDQAPAEVHFATLASCDHSVVSVGSYGWWTAWLSGGLVMFYKKFPLANSYEAKGFVFGDYYPTHWFPVDD